MKSTALERTLETFGEVTSTNFQVAVTGKMYRALIDGIYSDKIGSIVRELGTNAFDGHIEGGNPEAPFFIHCPTDLKPEFYIRDYGIGMDHDKMTGVYSTLFRSDKDQTNDMVGQKGLGSKSPFAYSDQYFIHCYDGETARHYNACIGPEGIPQLIFAGAEECSEPRGVRVGLAVDPKDFEAFKTAIKSVAFGFTPVFETNLGDLASLDSVAEGGVKGDGWWAIPTGTDFHVGSARNFTWFIRQGCVIYPVAAQKGIDTPNCNRFKYVVDMPIGTVEVTQSREAVQYDAVTIENINTRFKEVQADYILQVEDRIKDIQSVADYFDTAAILSTVWMSGIVRTHPATGLTTKIFQLRGLCGVFSASRSGDQVNGRWSYEFRQQLNAGSGTNTYYVLKDIAPLLDADRLAKLDSEMKDPSDLTATEHRRVSRFLRHYLQAQTKRDESPSGVFVLDLPWSEDFWSKFQPNATLIPISFADLKNAVPRRTKTIVIDSVERSRRREIKEATPSLLRGINLAASPTGTLPVSGALGQGDHVAYCTSESWRGTSVHLWNLAQVFGITHLYTVSASMLPQITALKMRELMPACRARLRAEKADVGALRDFVTTTDWYLNDIGDLSRRIAAADNAQALFTKIVRQRGIFSDSIRVLRPMVVLQQKLTQTPTGYTSDQRDALGFLLTTPSSHRPTYKVRDVMKSNSESLVVKLIDGVQAASPHPEPEIWIDLLLQAQKLDLDYSGKLALETCF